MIFPEEITKCVDTGNEVASYTFYDGVHLVRKNNIPQTMKMSEIYDGSKFLVCCGYVMIGVKPTDFPTIERRVF